MALDMGGKVGHSGCLLTNAVLVAFLATTDLDRAQAFFGDAVGLSLLERTSFACLFDANGTSLRITLVDQLSPASYTVLGWVVTDIADCVRSMARRAVHTERFPAMDQDELGVWTTPSGDLVAWFKDPDGNLLSVTQLAQEVRRHS
jgi:catechol 2,3-dioxygenase-like lactoylglutathione lyase family enzyme